MNGSRGGCIVRVRGKEDPSTGATAFCPQQLAVYRTAASARNLYLYTRCRFPFLQNRASPILLRRLFPSGDARKSLFYGKQRRGTLCLGDTKYSQKQHCVRTNSKLMFVSFLAAASTAVCWRNVVVAS